jgi:hypothetical protein
MAFVAAGALSEFSQRHSLASDAVAARFAGIGCADGFSRIATGIRQGLLCERPRMPSGLRSESPPIAVHGKVRTAVGP